MNKSSRFLVATAVVTSLLSGSMGAARATEVVPVPAGFTITGSGFGHGVGMSQYGAQGMGLAGKSATQILTHYYKGTTVDAVEMADVKIRVGLLQDRAFVAIRGERIPDMSTGGGFGIVIDNGEAIPVAHGVVSTFTTVNGKTQVTVGGVVRGSGLKVVLSWDKANTVMQVRHGATASLASSALGTADCVANACSQRYRYGTLEITSGVYDDSTIDLVVVNTLRLSDEYLYGLGEVPSSWTPAAMQAQAIAGRSYAIMKKNNRLGCNCQIYATTLDQAFVGYSKEIEKVGSKAVGQDWVAAVNATIKGSKALVVRYKGSVISTYYSSSTGGKSQPTTEVWGASLPYAVSVDDPWSLDPKVNNRNTSWTATIDQKTLVARLKAQGVVVPDVWSMSVTGKYRSGGISELNISDSAGNITTLKIAPRQPVTPDELRGLLGTNSTYISTITPGIKTVPGSTSATAKKLRSVTKVNWPKKSIKPSDYNFKGKVSPAQVGATVKLQRKSGGKWKTVSTATTNSKGAWSIIWAGPTAGKHDLRITASNSKGTVKTTTKRVKMVGSIGIDAPKSAKRNASFKVSGSVTPRYEGVTVVLQRKVGNGSWKTVARVKTDSDGKWSSVRNVGSKKLNVSYRVKTSDTRLGKLTSKVKKTKVK
jgi:SpoIID/LytB domain protein